MSRKENAVIAQEAAKMDSVAITREKADQLYGDGFPFDQQRLEERIKARNANTAEMMVQVGRDYHWLKNYLNHGEFKMAIERTGLSYKWAYFCMKAADMFSKVPPGELLGFSQVRALTVLERPIIEEYLNGGDLGDIPHDDVTKMTTGELEAECRKLRKKLKEKSEATEDIIRQKQEIIADLEIRASGLSPLTTEQKQKRLAEKELARLLPELYNFMVQAFYNLDEAVKLVVKAQGIPSADVTMLDEWANAHRAEMKPIFDVLDELEEAMNNICPDKPKDERLP